MASENMNTARDIESALFIESALTDIPGCGFEIISTEGEVPIERIIAVTTELARQKPGCKARFWIRVE